jgi:hypothetical protein
MHKVFSAFSPSPAATVPASGLQAGSTRCYGDSGSKGLYL